MTTILPMTDSIKQEINHGFHAGMVAFVRDINSNGNGDWSGPYVLKEERVIDNSVEYVDFNGVSWDQFINAKHLIIS
jgi:hypothetical protein